MLNHEPWLSRFIVLLSYDQFFVGINSEMATILWKVLTTSSFGMVDFLFFVAKGRGFCMFLPHVLLRNAACMLVDGFKVPWQRMFVASMGSILFMETRSHDITGGITHILLVRTVLYTTFFLHLLWFRFCCPTLAQVFVGQLSTKGSRVAMLRFMVALLMTVALAEGHMGRKGPLMDLFLRDHQWNRPK